VRPTVIGGGIGTQLLTQLLADARAVYPAVVLSVRAANPARRLYERLGFAVVDETINRVGGKSFVMLVNLRSW
jgi:ribosomal protein S18 acetylase RimI-like enzyme